jgi:hypothetical protein
MKPLFLTLLLFSAVIAVRPGNAASGSPVYSIRAEDAAHAVLAAHPELAGDQIELPSSIETREAAPVLEAGPLERWAVPARMGAGTGESATAARGRVRLRCQTENTCLPFYVWVHLPASDAPALPGSVQARQSDPVLRTGAHASMLIDSGLLHLRVPVTCLQGGSVGATIRVAGPARGRVYQVAIIDRATVRGSL